MKKCRDIEIYLGDDEWAFHGVYCGTIEETEATIEKEKAKYPHDEFRIRPDHI